MPGFAAEHPGALERLVGPYFLSSRQNFRPKASTLPLEECWLLRYDVPVAVPKHGHSKPWLLGDNAQRIYNASLLTLPVNSFPLPCHTCFDTVVGGRCRPNKATVVVGDEDHSSVVLILLEFCISRSGLVSSDSTNFYEAFLRFSGSY